MLAITDFSREDSRPAVYGVIDPEFAYCVEVGITGADLYWERELQLIEDELAEIEAWADYEARQHWRDDIEDVPFPSLEETWAELNSPEHIEMQARYGLTDF